MRYLSVCSGIEAATVAWEPMGWTAAGFSEIDKFPSEVLAHHYGSNMPGEDLAKNGVPNFGDFTTIEAENVGTIDLLVGGTPCQSFSIAGLRKGLADDRGNLALEYLRLADRTRPRWLAWENVPGVLSSNGGRDFGVFLGGMGEIGYGWSYRVLDAQYFGVAQRRRRVFVVGYLGNWRPATAVFLERDSMRGNPAPRRKKGQNVAGTHEARASTGGYDPGAHGEASGNLISCYGGGNTSGSLDAAACLTARGQRNDYEVETFVHIDGGDTARTLSARHDGSVCADRGPDIIAFSCKDDGRDCTDNLAPTLRSMNSVNGNQNAGGQLAVSMSLRGRDGEVMAEGGENVAHTLRASTGGGSHGRVAIPEAYSIMPMNSGKDFKGRQTDVAQPLMAGGPVAGNQGGDYLVQEGVRRLTPKECERLQGFPDRYTQIPRGKKSAEECPDGPRYKALGNSMAVPVMRWIGERIEAVDQVLSGLASQEAAE